MNAFGVVTWIRSYGCCIQADLSPNFHMFEYYFKSGTAIRNAYASTAPCFCELYRYESIHHDAWLKCCWKFTHEEIDGKLMYNTSCSTHLFKDALLSMSRKKSQGESVAIVGQVNNHLPYLYSDPN